MSPFAPFAAVNCNALFGHTHSRLEVAFSFRGTAHRLRIEENAGNVPAWLKHSEDDSVVPVAHWSAYLSVATSHSLTVLSLLAEVRVLPSGLNATDITAWVCPWRVARSLPV